MHAPQGGGFQGPSNTTAFWDESSYQARFKALWVEIASRYKYESSILAYDLINEPCPYNQSDYVTLMEETIAQVRAVDSAHLFNIEQSFSSDSEPFSIDSEEGIIYDFHFYDPWDSFTDSDNAVYGSDITQSTLLFNMQDYIDYYDGKVLHVSEFGQKYENFDTKNSKAWIEDSVELFDEYGIHYHYFSYKGNEFGLYENGNNFINNSAKNQTLYELFTDESSVLDGL
jgi:hypothetical protein